MSFRRNKTTAALLSPAPFFRSSANWCFEFQDGKRDGRIEEKGWSWRVPSKFEKSNVIWHRSASSNQIRKLPFVTAAFHADADCLNPFLHRDDVTEKFCDSVNVLDLETLWTNFICRGVNQVDPVYDYLIGTHGKPCK